jgi:cell division septal protein FtsQ
MSEKEIIDLKREIKKDLKITRIIVIVFISILALIVGIIQTQVYINTGKISKIQTECSQNSKDIEILQANSIDKQQFTIVMNGFQISLKIISAKVANDPKVDEAIQEIYDWQRAIVESNYIIKTKQRGQMIGKDKNFE